MPAAGGPRRVVVEADGGSRGNPGPAAYGAVLKDAATGGVIAEDAGPIGTATNNVAEYRGLIAGLELARQHAPEADVEVRMDSKLVVEQMAGRWKIKHQGLRPLAEQARALAERVSRWTWVPRNRNADADRLLNQALDLAGSRPAERGAKPPMSHGGHNAGLMTTLVLVATEDPAEAAAVADRLGVPLAVGDDPLAAYERLLGDYRGQAVAVVAPPKEVAAFVGALLEVPPSAVDRIQPASGSVSVICYGPEGTPVLRQLGVEA